MSIELKSTGFLIDEYLTTELKLDHFGKTPEILLRLEQLDVAIQRRLKNTNGNRRIVELYFELKKVLKLCWDAQEIVMSADLDWEKIIKDDSYYYRVIEIGIAAKDAQKFNAQRNKLIREIDTLLGESQYTQLEKSYA